MRNTKGISVFLFCFLLIWPLHDIFTQQSGEPEEPEIILPTMLLKIHDVEVAEVDVVLPESEDIAVQALNMPLPSESEIEIPDELFKVPMEQGNKKGGFQYNEGSEGSSFYSSGILGVGLANHILGSISLYKLGQDPRFRFNFSHEGLDGYQFMQAGSGYFHREDILDGWLSFEEGKIKAESSVTYTESEKGLQGQANNYYSGTNRYLEALGSMKYSFKERFSIEGELEGKTINRLLSVSDTNKSPSNAYAYQLSPFISAFIGFPKYDLHVRSLYTLNGMTGPSKFLHHIFTVILQLDVPLPHQFLFQAEPGIQWSSKSGLNYPFSLSISKTIKNILNLSLTGGYQYIATDYIHFWEEYPLLAIRENFTDQFHWNIGTELDWNIIKNILSLSGGLSYYYYDRLIRVETDKFDPTQGVFPFIQPQNTKRIKCTFGIQFSPIDTLLLKLHWNGYFLDVPTVCPTHEISFSSEYTGDSDKYGMQLETNFPFRQNPAPKMEIPLLGINGFYRITKDIRILLEAEDILSPVLQNGRTTYGPFIGPGFLITIKTQISL